MSRALAERQELETQGSGGAPHPAESTADAAQLGGLPTVRLKLGCFNCGLDQKMLEIVRHQISLGRVLAKAVNEQDLHICTLCEVGGHKKGQGPKEPPDPRIQAPTLQGPKAPMTQDPQLAQTKRTV